jgi:hypothetical protein
MNDYLVQLTHKGTKEVREWRGKGICLFDALAKARDSVFPDKGMWKAEPIDNVRSKRRQ